MFPLVLTLAFGAVGCAATVSPSGGERIDVLDFVLGDPALWPRHGEPNHHQHQNLEPDRVCWTKYTLPWSYECWRWDENYVYHAVDHAIDGARRWEHYMFSDGRWLPRRLSIGDVWTLDLPDNRIRWFDAECAAEPERAFPYHVRAWVEPRVDAGGDLGIRDVLILEYQPYDPANPRAGGAERFSFARSAGWFAWRRADGAGVTFNRVGGVARRPAPLCARDFQG